MQLCKQIWSSKDIQEFLEYIKNFSRPEKIEWTQKIVNTKKPCLAILSKNIKEISKKIFKGNYISFLDNFVIKYYECELIVNEILCKIKNYDIFEKYLIKFAINYDNWSSCDTIKFNIKNNEEKFFKLSKKLIKSNNLFLRRIGIRILFKFVNKKYLNNVFEIIKLLKNEEEYYVNMAISWLVCECFINFSQQTIKLFENHILNKFCNNKAISKCRDSFRVTTQQKENLNKFIIK